MHHIYWRTLAHLLAPKFFPLDLASCKCSLMSSPPRSSTFAYLLESYSSMLISSRYVCYNSISNQHLSKHIFHSDIQWLDSPQCKNFVFDFQIQNLDSFLQTFFSCKPSCKHSTFVSAQEFLTHFDGY